MSDEVDNLVNQIVQAIEIALNPTSNAETRLKANTFIEEIKNGLSSNFEQSFSVAFKLLNYTENRTTTDQQQQIILLTKMSNVNNFGLQIIELIVKFNWNKLTDNSKIELKRMIEKVICKQDFSVTTLMHIYENRLLKDQFSRLLVEILMREWPQNWPNFLSSCLNQPKNDLVLYTLWRLSEDIGIFYLPNNPYRRRDMNNKLTENLDSILNYIADCLVLDNIELTILALKTLCSFFEWNTLKPDALTFLCKVLTVEMNDTDNLFRLFNCVADCFFTCLHRKSFKQDEKKILLVFFEEQNLTVLINFLEKLLPFVQLKIESKVIDEKTFDLIKRICDMFQLMGQICVSLTLSSNSALPTTWQIYLHVMLKLLEYDNQIYNYYSLQFWKDLFKNSNIKDGQISDELFMKIINILPYKMVKKEEMNNIFLVYEFDGSADYDVFFTRFRAEFGDFLRSLTKNNEKLCFNLAISLIKQTLQNNGMNKNEWSTISIILDAVCNNLANAEQFSEEALPVLKFMISMDNLDDPELMSTHLSCLSALSIFMQYSKEDMFKNFLTKVFSLMNFGYSDGPTFELRNKQIRELRRHVCSLFIRLSLKNSTSLLPLFSNIKDYVHSLDSRPEIELTQNEKCSLFEGLIVLSNNFVNYYQQTEFILEILKPVAWLIEYRMSTLDFIKHIGLTSPQIEWNLESYSTNRTSLVYAVNIINVIIKRVNRKVVLLPDVLPYIASMTKLIKNLNEMWNPEIQELCYPDYRQFIYAPILETERIALLDSVVPDIKKQQKKKENETFYNIDRMQTFLWLLHENCYTAIGNASGLLKLEFYNNLETIDLIHAIDNLPDFKFKIIFRTCMKPLISNCPKSETTYEKKIFPLFYRFLPAFFEKINQKWELIKQTRSSDVPESTVTSNQDQFEAEILEEEICRNLSKEFIDFLCLLLIDKLTTSEDEKLSSLGIYILKQIPDLLFMTATMMAWLDSTISMKATTLTLKIIDKLAEDEIIKTSNTVGYIMKQLMIALSYFGEHDQNQALLLNLFIKIYENYVVQYNFVDIRSQLVEYSGKNIRSWNNYEEKTSKNATAKKKREAIKNLLNNVIGKNLSQLFKQQGKEEIKNLEPLLSRAEKVRQIEKLNSDFDEDDLDDTFWKFF